MGCVEIPETWGWYSVPPKAAKELRLRQYLAEVPTKSVVLDVGAGSGLSMAAAAFVERQDVTIISVDPGFALPGIEETMQTDIDHAVTYFQPDEQLLLRSATSWQANTVVGRGEDLPVGDASVDLLVSYAAVPLYSPDAMDEIAAECSRVLKTGVVALHGPMYERVFDKWERALRSAVEKQAFSGFESRVEEIEVADGSYADAYFTVATR